MVARIDYDKAFRELLDAVPEDQRLSFREVAAAASFAGVSAGTVKNHFKAFIDVEPAYLSRVGGIYTKPDVLDSHERPNTRMAF